VSLFYKWQDFLESCKRGEVFVPENVKEDARLYFQLYTPTDILAFIEAGGLVPLTFRNSRPFEKWGGKPPAPIIDAYTFIAGAITGYIAIYKSRFGKWTLKSFHPDNENPASINRPFLEFKNKKILQNKIV
jgi:hypothetical protein